LTTLPFAVSVKARKISDVPSVARRYMRDGGYLVIFKNDMTVFDTESYCLH
jgi:hypothetical protein